MVEWRRERRRWVAILAAYAIVLQALLGGLGTASAAPAPMLDAFGGVICSFDGAGHGTPVEQPHHRDNACLALCALSVHAALPPPAAPAVHARFAWHVAAPDRPTGFHDPATPAIGPLGPRGPPA